MPASRSRNRTTDAPASRARAWPYVLIGVAALLVVIAAALPASLIARFLPPQIRAGDFSGTLWHGSAGQVSANGRSLGAVEWHLHPWALLGLNVAVDLRWVKGGFVIDGNAKVDRHGVLAHDLRGGGPIEDLADFGVAAGWHGSATLDFAQLQSDFSTLQSVSGNIEVADLSSPQVAGGAALGGYQLIFQPDSLTPDGTIIATLNDTGGPVEAQAQISYAQTSHVATLSGTLKERNDAAPALRSQLQSLSQLKPRDGQGRIPVDLEFSL